MVNVLLSTGIVSAGEFASFKGGVNRKIELVLAPGDFSR